ncbi:reverse transcriptase domain-containing protein [Tanacetum coccineum]
MTSPARGGAPEGQDDRERTPPLTKEQIEGHISAMKSIIKDHNKRNKANPIRLNFEIEDQDPNEDRIVKGKEVDDEDLTRGWFKSLSPNSIDEWWKLREAFNPRYSTRKACYKEPHEITKIVRKANETLTAFKERWIVKTGFIIGVLEVMKISSFMDSVKSPELAKRFASNVPKTVDEMMKCLDEFLPEETTETVGTTRENISERETIEILTRPETTSIQEDTEITELHTPKGSKQTEPYRIGKAESLDERPEAEGGKETKQKPSSAEAKVEGYLVRRVYVDEGSSVEVMFEHCFENLPERVRAGLRETRTDLVGFAGEVAKPLGKIDLEILHAIPSTIHSMIKFPTPKGIATLIARTITIAECRLREEKQMIREETPQEEEGVDVTEQIIVNPSFPDQMVTIGGRLSKDCKEQLKTLLKGNMEVFAWEPADMTGVPRKVIEHALNVNPSLDPVCQKRRTFSPEKSGAVTKEVTEWIKAGIVRPVKYPTYISNPVLVKKCDGSWRMCIDFKNLNSACPKDYYPLPNIDCKVEAVMGFKYKCFLDAYKGYHQIQMAKEDEEKTAFYTEQGTYCYTKMSFGLKNAGATYQRLVDSTFQNQIGRNLEAYVDDMVIKSKEEKSLLADIAETFESLKTINMKLNPKKCSFGVEEGKFLGYMVTSEGIRANPKKTRAISDLQSPKTLKEMQSLSGKLASLNRFLAKSAERALPFFNTLKNITKENKHEYRWTPEAEEAFQQMKRLIMSLPSLTPPFPKETLYAYLAVSKEAVSAVLLTDRNGRQCPVQYKADGLSKLATVPFHHLTKEILVKVLSERSTEVQEVQTIVEEEGKNWMTPITKFLEEGIVSSNKNEARALRAKIGQYTMESGVLFKKGYLIPMLRCVGPLQANYVIREIHMGSCGMHVGPRAVVRKAMRQGYYWPTMHADAKTEVDKCDSCQIHSPIPRLPKTFMTSIMAPWPFYQWGMDILGPLTPARGGAKFVIVAIDYFTKWVEAKPLVKITGKEIIRFVMDNIICRYGLPRVIVTDNGAQLVSDPFKSWCTRFEIQQMNTAVAHPQANGLVERANRSLMEGIKTRLGREKAGWVDELPNVLWAHRTSIKQSNGETPFSLTYGSETVILAEIGMPSYRTLMIREEFNEEEQRLNLDLLQERREAAAIREARYKTKMEQYYNKKVRPAGFRPGEFVYRMNEASRVEDQGKLVKRVSLRWSFVFAQAELGRRVLYIEGMSSRVEDQGKLGPKWEGPYRVTEAFENGSYKLQTMEDKIVPRTWHAINLRKCYL